MWNCIVQVVLIHTSVELNRTSMVSNRTSMISNHTSVVLDHTSVVLDRTSVVYRIIMQIWYLTGQFLFVFFSCFRQLLLGALSEKGLQGEADVPGRKDFTQVSSKNRPLPNQIGSA